MSEPADTHGGAPRIEPLGDSALLVRLGDAIGTAEHRRVRAAHARVARAQLRGVRDVVPAFTTLTVHFDLLDSDFDSLAQQIASVLGSLEEEVVPEGRLHEIPVRYGGVDGPDLELVAGHAGLAAEEVVRRHTAAEYVVHMIGFAPGFPYLAGLDPAIACPRRDSPRVRVPTGSVGIGGTQTGIYPSETPGGWQLIGRTALVLFDPIAEPPGLLAPGDRVRFVAVRS